MNGFTPQESWFPTTTVPHHYRKGFNISNHDAILALSSRKIATFDLEMK